MESLLILLGLVVLAIPVAVVYLLVAHSGLRGRIARLETDIARLMAEQNAASQGDVTPAAPKATPDPERSQPGPPEPARPLPAAARVIEQRKADGAGTEAPKGPTLFARTMQWVARNWFYVVSAVSLALAGLFLVQYGVENGVLPPAARVLAALGFGAVLIAAGEVIRRRFGDGAEQATAYLPSVFSGAGLVSLFGGVVAARLLYDLVGVETAFAGLAAVGLLGVVLGWFHGPFLSVVGVVGAFAAPFLVGSPEPATAGLYGYFAIVTAVGLGIDTVRRWAWVSALSVALGCAVGWLVWMEGGRALTLGFQAYIVGIAVMAILIPARGLRPDHQGPLIARWLIRPNGARPAFPTLLGAVACGVAVFGLASSSSLEAETFWLATIWLVVLALALTYWSMSGPALQDLAVLPVVGLVIVVAQQGLLHGDVLRGFDATYDTTPEADFPLAVTLLWAIGLGLSASAAVRARFAGFGLGWALGAAFIAPVVAITLEVMWKPVAVIGAYPWALHAMVMAAVMVIFALQFGRMDGAYRTRMSVFVLSAFAAISFAMVLILSSAALTVALAVTVLVAAWLDRRFDVPLMQIIVAVGVVAVGARLVADPGLDWALDAPLWEVLLAYGGALAAFCASLWLLVARQRPTAQVMLDTAAWSVGGILVSLLLFRFLDRVTAGDARFAHWAMGLYATIWLGLMVAQILRLERLGGLLAVVRAMLAVVFGVIGFGALFLGVTVLSPLEADFGGDVTGPAVLNTLLVAYLLPAGLLALGVWRMRGRWWRYGFGAVAVSLAVYWGFAALRHVWQGADGMQLSAGFLQPELYSYTVAILGIGAVLFYQSLAQGSVVLRRAGLVVIGLAVAKVFLVDVSGLQGLTRVLSLVVLGVSLAGLAWLNRWAQSRAGSD